MSDNMEEMRQRQQQANRHDQNLARHTDEDTKAPETLKYISEPEDSVDSPADSLSWINSKSASTANLSNEDVRSKDWVLEYHQLLSRMEHPPQYGLTGHLRAWAYDDRAEYRKPLSSSDLLETEGYTEIGKEATTRSKDGWGVETSTRDTKESIVRNDEDGGSGGILGRLRK
jgi:hypothetical protein